MQIRITKSYKKFRPEQEQKLHQTRECMVSNKMLGILFCWTHTICAHEQLYWRYLCQCQFQASMVRHAQNPSSKSNRTSRGSHGKGSGDMSYQLVPTRDTPHVSMQVSGSSRGRSHGEKRRRSHEEQSAKWSTLLKDFTQETTLHGIRYATARSRFVLRR